MNAIMAFIERVSPYGEVRDYFEMGRDGQPRVLVWWVHGGAMFELACDYSWQQDFDHSHVNDLGFSLDGHALELS